MGLVRTSNPSVEPVVAADMIGDGGFLRVDDTDEQSIVTNLCKAGRERCEEVAEIALITQTWKLTLPSWPCGMRIIIPRPPLQSVSSITYVDTVGTTQTLSSTYYDVDLLSDFAGVITVKRGKVFPSVWAGQAAVIVTFVAGYGADATFVPQEIKERIKNYVAYCFEHRTDRDEDYLDSLFTRFSSGRL